MCEFCLEHDDGKKWFNRLDNYSADLLRDLERRGFIEEFYTKLITNTAKDIDWFERMLKRSPKIIGLLLKITKPFIIRRLKKDHFGQVITGVDAKDVLNKATSIVKMPCGCRWFSARKDVRCCLGISFGPPDWYKDLDIESFGIPDLQDLEQISKEDAIKIIEDSGRKKLIHTIWTMGSPFIGGICNCNLEECLAVRSTVNLGVAPMFKGHEVADVEPVLCNGCSACQNVCKFNAVKQYSLNGEKKFVVNVDQCFGCGLCERFCKEDAVKLYNREEIERVKK